MSSNTLSSYGSDGAARERPYRIALGIGLSVVVHAVLLFAYRSTGAPRQPDIDIPARSIAVWLRPPPPAVAQAPQAEPPKPVRERKVARARPQSTPPAPIALPEREERATPDMFTVQPAPAAEPDADAPRFDPDAARKLARDMAGQMAREPDAAHAGTALERLAPKPLETETRAARAIASAKRRDCKDGLPGGLLGPLLILLDKKDSGCKW